MDQHDADPLREKLTARLAVMALPKLLLIDRMIDAMGRAIEQDVFAVDELFTADFIDAIGDQLLLHHGTHDEPASKKLFEYVFRNAAEATGHSATINPQTTDAGADVIVDGIRFSLKTEAARRQSRNGIQIQKLMEARWVRDVHSPEEIAAAATSLIPAHLANYERIVVLRGLPRRDDVLYTLVEVPKDLLLLIRGLTARDFSEKNAARSSGADVYDHSGTKVFRILLDGSVEKVRIFSLQLSACVVRARWRIPLGENSVTEGVLFGG